jgi:hypothetical protein
MIERRPSGPPRLARLISIAAHPFVLSPLTVALASRNWRWTLIVAASTILPIVAVILWKMHQGVWSDFDVSDRQQRSSLYWYAIPIFLAVYFFLPAHPDFRRSVLALVAALLVALALSRFLKTSLHLLCAALCAVVLWQAYPWSALVMAAVLAALAWSRWILKHHTPAEIATGTLLGLGAGIYTIS